MIITRNTRKIGISWPKNTQNKIIPIRIAAIVAGRDDIWVLFQMKIMYWNHEYFNNFNWFLYINNLHACNFQNTVITCCFVFRKYVYQQNNYDTMYSMHASLHNQTNFRKRSMTIHSADATKKPKMWMVNAIFVGTPHLWCMFVSI